MAQFLRPSADIANPDGFTPTPLWAELDEVVPDDGVTQVEKAILADSTASFTVGLSDGVDPAVNTGHIVRVKCRNASVKGGGSFGFALKEGGVTRATRAAATFDGTTWLQLELTLSGAQADSITDYSDLEIAVSFTSDADTFGITCASTWVEFQIPPSAGQTVDAVLQDSFGFGDSTIRLLDTVRLPQQVLSFSDGLVREAWHDRIVQDVLNYADAAKAAVGKWQRWQRAIDTNREIWKTRAEEGDYPLGHPLWESMP